MSASPPRDGGSDVDIETILARMAPPSAPAECLQIEPRLVAQLNHMDKMGYVAALSGLMTEPLFQANAIRFDWAIRLVLSYAKGKRKPKRNSLQTFLNVLLTGARVTRLEDPIEDFFTEAVPTSAGDYLIFSGNWEKAGISTEALLSAFETLPSGQPKDNALEKAYGLLRLSSALAARAKIDRRCVGDGSPSAEISLPPEARIKQLARRVQFKWEELEELGIAPSHVATFELSNELYPAVANCTPGNSPLEFYPLIRLPKGILIAAPGNISTAVRALLITTAVKGGMDEALCLALLEEYRVLLRHSNFIEPQGPVQMLETCAIRQSIYKESEGHFVNVIQIADNFQGWPRNAFGGQTMHSRRVGSAMLESILSAKTAMENLPEYVEGMSLVLICGWGGARGIAIPHHEDLESWLVILLEAGDACTLGGCKDGRFIDQWRMHKQLGAVEAQGFEFMQINGPLNLFQWWRDTDHEFIPGHLGEIQPPTLINFDTGLLLKARIEGANAFDRRSVRTPSDNFLKVIRLNHFASDGSLEPIYASPDDALEGKINGVIAHSDNLIWLALDNNLASKDGLYAYETWAAAAEWIALVFPIFAATYAVMPDSFSVMVRMRISPLLDHKIRNVSDEEVAKSIVIKYTEEGTPTILVQSEWLLGLYRPDNEAEVILATKVFWCVAQAIGADITENTVRDIVVSAAGSRDLRWRHVFEVHMALDFLISQDLVPRFNSPSHSASALILSGSVWRVHKRENGLEIQGKDKCVEFLERYTNTQFEMFCSALRRYDRRALVVATLESMHAAMARQRNWKNTARALRAIVGAATDEKISLENIIEANAVIRASTIISEVAASEAPVSDGHLIGRVDLSELQARAVLHFQNSDTLAALYGDRIEPRIRITPTGHLQYDHEFEKLTMQFSAGVHNRKERENASEEYIGRFEKRAPLELDEELNDAVKCEYGVHMKTLANFPFALAMLGGKKKHGVLTLRRSEILDALMAMDEVSDSDLGALMDRLTLPARKGWVDLPPNCSRADFDLGKFDRRYSLIGRPIVALRAEPDPMLAIAPGVIDRALLHNINGALTGSLQGSFWSSAKMREFAGRQGDRAGNQFNARVAERIKDLGLATWHSVALSWCLNAKATQELKLLGDIDVLAVSPNRRVVWVVEAKDLKLCRTLGEMASRLSEFRGRVRNGKPDRMLKHLRRVDYLRGHAEQLVERLKLPVKPDLVVGVMIVNGPQPMQQFHSEVPANGRVVMLEDAASIPWDAGWQS